MTIAFVSTVLAAPVDEVWKRFADFAGWDSWIPRIASIKMDPGDEAAPVGGVRNLTMADGRSVRERLVHKDALARSLAYEFPDGSMFPVRRYLGTVRVEEITMTGGTYVHWSGDFDADAAGEEAMIATFTAIYQSFLRDLADALGAAT